MEIIIKNNFIPLYYMDNIFKNIYMHNDVYKKIPNLLLKHRKISGLSQKKVARVLGVQPGMLCKWEKGICIPNLVIVFKLAILYRTMADSLFMDLIHYLRKEMKVKMEKMFPTDSFL